MVRVFFFVEREWLAVAMQMRYEIKLDKLDNLHVLTGENYPKGKKRMIQYSIVFFKINYCQVLQFL